jgi:hypothetical protein
MTHPTRRFLFTVDVTGAGKLFYSVAGPDEVTAFQSLQAGDKNCMLIFDDIEVHRKDPPAVPVCLGLDPQYRSQRNA